MSAAVDRFAGLVEELRAIAEKTAPPQSPIAMMMQDEIDGPARKFIRGIYVAGGLPSVAGAVREALSGGMSSRALVEELDRIVAMERDG